MDSTKRLKVLHVIDSGGLYGAEKVLLSLASEQIRQGSFPTIASIGEPHCGEKPIETAAMRRGISVAPFRMRAGPNLPGVLHILRFVRRERFDVLHSHGYKGDIFFGFMPKWARRIPVVSTVHGWTGGNSRNKLAFYEWLDGVSLSFIERIVVVSESMQDHARLHRHVQKMRIVNNGIPWEENLSGEEDEQLDPRIVDFCQHGFVLGAAGRLSPEKGFGFLLDAFSEIAATHSDARLLILGEGNERSVLEAKARHLGIEARVLMPGFVNDLQRYLKLMQVFILSSLTEGQPMVILEAMRERIPVIASSVGGVPDMLSHGEAGMLVEAGSISSLAAAIRQIIKERGPATLRAERAVDLVRTKYSVAAMAYQYHEIYADLIREYRSQDTAA